MEHQPPIEPLDEIHRIWSLRNNLYRFQPKQIESRREESRRIYPHDPLPQLATQRIINLKKTDSVIHKKIH